MLPERVLETSAAAGGLWEPETLRLVMSLNMSRPEHGHNDIKRDRSRDFPSVDLLFRTTRLCSCPALSWLVNPFNWLLLQDLAVQRAVYERALPAGADQEVLALHAELYAPLQQVLDLVFHGGKHVDVPGVLLL